MLVHHSNIEIDSNDSLFFLRKTRESKIKVIKDSIELTHGSLCSDVRKLQSMDVLKLQSTEADWNTKYPFHILAYIYSNLLDISTSYFIKVLSCRERLDVDSQRAKKCTFHLDFRGERVENKEK